MQISELYVRSLAVAYSDFMRAIDRKSRKAGGYARVLQSLQERTGAHVISDEEISAHITAIQEETRP